MTEPCFISTVTGTCSVSSCKIPLNNRTFYEDVCVNIETKKKILADLTMFLNMLEMLNVK